MNWIKHHRPLLACGLVVLLNVLLECTNFDIQPIHPSIDAAYVYAYNLFFTGALDPLHTASTYGPLGFLVHAVAIGNLQAILLVCNIVFGVVAGLVVYGLTRHITGFKRYVFIVALSLLTAFQVFEWRFLVLLLMIELYLYLQKRVTYGAVALLAVIASLMCFIKLSLGVVACLSVVLWLVLKVWGQYKDLLRYAVLFAAIFVVTTVICLGTLRPSAIAAFFAISLQTMSGYSPAMALEFTGWQATVALFLIATLLVVGWFALRVHKRQWVFLLLPLLCLFFVWKAAMVRQDAYGHIEAYALFMLFVVVFLALYVVRLRVRLKWWDMAGALVVGGLLIWGVMLGDITHQRVRSFTLAPLTFWKIETCGLAPCVSTDTVQLPPEARALIGDHTADVYPWQLTYLPVNNLRWAARPVFASYAAFTPPLDNADAAFYASSKAPEFIIWDHRDGVFSIDGRHLLFDEPATVRSVLRNYRNAYISDEKLLSILKRNARIEQPKTQAIASAQHLDWDKWTAVPASKSRLYAQISYHPKLSQKAGEILFRPIPITITFKKKSGQEQTHRVVTRNLSQGILVNQLPFGTAELQQLLRGEQMEDTVAAYKVNAPATGELTLTYLREQ